MNASVRKCLAAVACAGLLAGGAQAASLGADTVKSLATLPSGHALLLTGFPAGPSRTATLRFERAEIYAPGARIQLGDGAGAQDLPRSDLRFLRGRSADGSVRVALAFRADGSFDSGSGDGPDGTFVLEGARLAGGGQTLEARAMASTAADGTRLDFICGNEFENLDARNVLPLAHALRPASTARPAATQALRLATLAIDTDTPFMSILFSNNTASATNWIAKMINAMNVMYEADLAVQLQQGTTILRTNPATDPFASGGAYPVTAFPANNTDLGNFGAYWAANQAGVQRTFAALLSGKGVCNGNSCSASGIAWIDSYCRTASNGGSYSVAMLYPNIAFDPNGVAAARLEGHELGHNFGADHTHCTDATSGASRVAGNTIDQCYNGEAANGCYAGATSCPASGPGAPAGTIMSYCNVKGCNGGKNVMQFHPTQITKVLLPDIAATISGLPGCLGTSDVIFANGFEP